MIDDKSTKNYPHFVNILQAFPAVRLHSKYVTPAVVIDEAVQSLSRSADQSVQIIRYLDQVEVDKNTVLVVQRQLAQKEL